MPQQPPNVDGIMDLSDADKTSIRAKLEKIRSEFQPTDEQPICDTFYLVSTYNKQNPTKPVNGDTAEAILS